MTVSVNPGDVIDGSYVIERLLGMGGMGAVFVAREERLGRHVAIKVLLDAVAKIPEAVTRFEREGRSAAALQSDHVTRVLSVGHLQSGAPYIVMELLEGEDLAGALTRRGPLPIDEVVGYVMHACEALAEAHSLGIVHRDLKPANIFLARRGTGAPRVKILDFGISKNATAASSKALTATTAIMGTPLYMSPEQLREARNVDGRADVWALGIVMYELLSGAPPFNSEALAELCVFIMTTQHAPLSSRRPGLPPALDAIVNRCLAKDPADRFASAHELMVALSNVGPAPAWQPSQPAGPNATPLMSPRPPTDAIAARARMQARTEAPAQTPPPVAQSHMPTQSFPQPGRAWQEGPGLHGMSGQMGPQMGTGPGVPVGHPAGGNTAPPVQGHAATVDPVSNSQFGSNSSMGLPSKRPNLLGLFVVFAVALGVGGVVFWQLVLRSTGGSGLTAATASGAPTDSAQAATTASAHASASAFTTAISPSSSASSAHAGAPLAPANPVRLTPLAAQPGMASTPIQQPPAGLPPPSHAAVPAQPPVQPPPAVPPTKPPPPSPTTLMPGARN